MSQPTDRAAWIKAPKTPNWGFDRPKQELVKVVVDLRPKPFAPALPRMPFESAMPPMPFPTGPSSLSAAFKRHEKAKKSHQPELTEDELGPLFRKENRLPGSFNPRNIKPFGGDINPFGGNLKSALEKYFGGPIFNHSISKWQPNFYTRSAGDIVGAAQYDIPLPSNADRIIRSTAVMSSQMKSQSAIWVAPRLLMSTLHLYNWYNGHPSESEVDKVRQEGHIYRVEDEISGQLLGPHSPGVRLVEFSAADDLGLFQLEVGYPDRKHYIDFNWLAERDELLPQDINAGSKMGCIGYNGRISEEDATKVKEIAMNQLCLTLGKPTFFMPELDLNVVTKPGFRSFAPGSLDKAEISGRGPTFGVSSTLWKGSSGGPCFFLDGKLAGVIIGLVLADVVTLPTRRGEGAASELVKWGLSLAEAHHLPTFLHCPPFSTSHGFFVKHGFDEPEKLSFDLRPWGIIHPEAFDLMIRPAQPLPPPGKIIDSPWLRNADFLSFPDIEDAAFAKNWPLSDLIFGNPSKTQPQQRSSSSSSSGGGDCNDVPTTEPDIELTVLRVNDLINSVNTDPTVHYIKGFDPTTGQIFAAAHWHFYDSSSTDTHVFPPIRYPQIGGNPSLGAHYFDSLLRTQEAHMRGQPYLFLRLLVVLPSHQGQGIGTRLLRWGLQHADRLGVRVWTDVSLARVGPYRKLGWEEVSRLEVKLDEWGGQAGITDVTVSMVREPRK